jgi:hypothetical protein
VSVNGLASGANTVGYSKMREVTPLFDPRHERWTDHFVFKGTHIQGLSATGRATVQVLAMNDARRIELRQELLTLGESL